MHDLLFLQIFLVRLGVLVRCHSNDVAEILPNLASEHSALKLVAVSEHSALKRMAASEHSALKRMAASKHSALKLMAASSQGAASRGMSAWETDAAVCRQRTVAETSPSELVAHASSLPLQHVVRPTLLVAR